MTEQEFAKAFEEALSLDGIELHPHSVFGELHFWDSLCVLLTIAFADETFGKSISGRQIATAKTVSDLWMLLDTANA